MEKINIIKTKDIKEENKKQSDKGKYGDINKINKKALLKLLKCPLCEGIFRVPTIINECMHIFCRSCIIKYIFEIGIKSCPICETKLGDDPMKKLKKEYTINSLIEILFEEFEKIDQENNVYINIIYFRKNYMILLKSIMSHWMKIRIF